MKKAIVILMAIAMGAGAASAQGQKEPGKPTMALTKVEKSPVGKLSFKEVIHEFGEVPEGDSAAYDFVFTNTGRQPVIISKAVPGCGCTTPYWPHQPLMPGTKDKIHVSFNTAGRPGAFTKQVTVFSDAEQATTVLTIKGMVKAKPVGIAASVPVRGTSEVVK